MNLYKDYAEEFSNTRKIPWKGWFKILPFLNKNKELKILDLGCGNARFLTFLVEQGFKISLYVGIDSSQEMLNIAYNEIRNLRLETGNQIAINFESNLIKENLDLPDWDKALKSELENSNLEPVTFNLIVGFGVIHHLKSFKARKLILEKSQKLLEKDGTLALSFWQFLKSERLKSLILEPAEIGVSHKSLGENDYYLTFGKDKKAYRFCHFTTEDEVAQLEENSNLKRVKDFYDDGKEGNLNYYCVWSLT